MVEYDRRPGESDEADIPYEIRIVMQRIGEMPGEPADTFMEGEGFVDLTDDNVNRGRGVWGHPETPGHVYKIGVEVGNFQNTAECKIWDDRQAPSYERRVDTEVHNILCPIADYAVLGTEYSWEIMERANIEKVSHDDVSYLWKVLDKNGWVVADLEKRNCGILNGEPVIVDYAMLRPQDMVGQNIIERKRDRFGDWREEGVSR